MKDLPVVCAEPNLGEVTLDVTGPEGSHEILNDWLHAAE